MASPLLVKVTGMVVVFMVSFGHIPLAEAELPCGEVQLTVAPCIGYLRDPSGPVPGPCCNGVRSINNQAKTTPDRQGVCRCLKTTVLSLPGLNLPSLAALPGKCGVNLPYKISPTIDCNTYDHSP
ncbi:Non-specific lipid-transfer protein [Spatholobus suberectus]|nr:Non-specific lipid-transfer protein [Spatholobus suberectus]